MQPIRRMVGYVRMGPETSINTDELRRNEERLRLLIWNDLSRGREFSGGDFPVKRKWSAAGAAFVDG
jgi:hypothetical protein